MKIFFLTSPRANLKIGKKIYQIIHDIGHNHTSDFVIKINPQSFYKVDEKTWEKRYQLRNRQLSQADICIFETSIPSLAIGQLFQEAVRQEKPTIALHQKGKFPYTLMGAVGNEKRVQILEYEQEADLDELIKYALEEASSQLNTRFTMLLSSEYVDYLNKINQEEGLSRSEYIRKLIRQEMKKKEVA